MVQGFKTCYLSQEQTSFVYLVKVYIILYEMVILIQIICSIREALYGHLQKTKALSKGIFHKRLNNIVVKISQITYTSIL